MNDEPRFGPKDRLRIVCEGMWGDRSVDELCQEYRISTTTYYRWRELVFRRADRLFERPRRRGGRSEVT